MFQIRLSRQRIYESINNAIWSKPEAVTEVPETLHYRLAANKFHDWELLQDIHSLWAKWFIDMTSHLQEKKKKKIKEIRFQAADMKDLKMLSKTCIKKKRHENSQSGYI